ncbi:MAG: DNA-processing protein DprA, partial [Pseudomonadota bacterium]
MDDDLSWLRLTRSRNVGPRSFQRLVGRYGSAKEALKALPEIANRAGERTYQLCSERQGAAEIERAEKLGASMLRLGAPGYPSRLAEIADPPPFLWALGDASLTERSTLAIIGARNASSIGRKLARMLASDLGADGHIIVSGLARGIDRVQKSLTQWKKHTMYLAASVSHVSFV